MANRLNIYASSHINSKTVCEAFAKGSGGTLVPPAPLLPGDVFMYGCLRGLEPTLRQAQKEGRNWYYCDNGYIMPGHFDGYFRVTQNAYQIDGRGVSDGKRFAKLKLHVKPWRTAGKHIVVCPPSQVWCRIVGIDHAGFISDTYHRIKAATARPLLVRHKPAENALEADLSGAWCLVTYSSNAAVEAVLAGIPVVCLGRCAASAMSGTLEQIENLPTPDRTNWLGVLADNQWSLEEMKTGLAWQMLQKAGSVGKATQATAP